MAVPLPPQLDNRSYATASLPTFPYSLALWSFQVWWTSSTGCEVDPEPPRQLVAAAFWRAASFRALVGWLSKPGRIIQATFISRRSSVASISYISLPCKWSDWAEMALTQQKQNKLLLSHRHVFFHLAYPKRNHLGGSCQYIFGKNKTLQLI